VETRTVPSNKPRPTRTRPFGGGGPLSWLRASRRRPVVAAILALLYILPAGTLLTPVSPLPLVGIPLIENGPRMLTIAGLLLIAGGIGWAFININSLPMVVELTTAARLGTFTGLYYLFSTFSAILGPNVNGWAIQASGNNYNVIMLIAPFFMLTALVLMLGVRRGEATP